MNPITLGAKTGTTISTAKFDRLTFSENGLLLKYRNKQEIEIPFDEIEKVYMKKHKLNPFVEFLCISIPFLFVFMAIQYLPFDLMIFVSIITVLPVLITVINYKWYRFNVHLKDGTFFSKKVRLEKKTENIITLNKIQKEFLCYNSAHLTSA